MVEISLSGSGEGPGWVTAPGYSTAAFPVLWSVIELSVHLDDAGRGGKAPCRPPVPGPNDQQIPLDTASDCLFPSALRSQ